MFIKNPEKSLNNFYMKISKEEILKYHLGGKTGLAVTKPCATQKELSMAYTPGVALPCLEIKKNKKNLYKYTNKKNTVAVITNGTAVLGLGNIGVAASKPVMEGKAVLFKKFANIDAIDIEVDETDPKKFVEIVSKIATGFGGINLEDIKAPECFYIERELQKRLDIPVFHDDQHGTAIIAGAALLNALKLVKKDIKKIKIIFSGMGAAGTACYDYFLKLGVKKENVKRVDKFTINKLEDYIKDADVFMGLSVANVLTIEMIKTMAKDPLVFALANPNPEIKYELAMKSRPDIIFATGRSDYPNQINNVLGFPYIFRGALDAGTKKITLKMQMAATKSLANLVRHPKRDYLVPKPFDARLKNVVSRAIEKAST